MLRDVVACFCCKWIDEVSMITRFYYFLIKSCDSVGWLPFECWPGMMQPEKLTEPSKLLSEVDIFIFDCDGVLWRGDFLIPGVPDVLEKLTGRWQKIVLRDEQLNQKRAGYQSKFTSLGLNVQPEEIFSSSFAAAAYLEQTKFKDTGKKVYIIGEKGISEELDLVGVPWLAEKEMLVSKQTWVLEARLTLTTMWVRWLLALTGISTTTSCSMPSCAWMNCLAASSLPPISTEWHIWPCTRMGWRRYNGSSGLRLYWQRTNIGWKASSFDDWLHCPEIWHHRQIPNLHGRWQVGHWHCFRAQHWIEDLFDTFWSHKWGWAAWQSAKKERDWGHPGQSSMWTPCVSFFLHDCLSAARVKEFEFSSSGLAELCHFRLGPGALFGKMLGTASFSTFAFIHLWTWCLCNLHRSARYLLGTSVSTSIDLFVRLQLALQNHRQVQKNTMERLLSMLDMFRCWGPYTLIFHLGVELPWPSHSSRNLFVFISIIAFTS